MSTTFFVIPGTLKRWVNTGGDAALTLTSLANAAAREGVSLDLGATFARYWGWQFKTKFANNPTALTLLRLFLGFSADNTVFDGALAKTDQALAAEANINNLRELAPLVTKANTAIQVVGGVFEATGRYVAPVVFNDGTGQALSSTAADHALTIWPLSDYIP